MLLTNTSLKKDTIPYSKKDYVLCVSSNFKIIRFNIQLLIYEH
jgi:hypothetical protein